jgi:transposase
MARLLLGDELWEAVQPLLPAPKPRRFEHPGRKPVDNRVCLTGILFVLKTGIPWEDFPQEMGCCGMTLWNRLHDWQQAGVWDQIHRMFLDRLNEADEIDWSRAVIDSAYVRAVGRGKKRAPAPSIGANMAPSTV